jgi:mRNA-degrading endonuclease RelE of RelBE toxin-antitoxin system
MIVEYSREFARAVASVRDRTIQDRVKKTVEKLIADPNCGKPLRYELHGKRSVRVPPFRIIYELRDDRLILLTFERRDTVYHQ